MLQGSRLRSCPPLTWHGNRRPTESIYRPSSLTPHDGIIGRHAILPTVDRESKLNQKTLNTLEFPKVRERLASHASFSLGKTLALELVPTTDITEARRYQRITTEAVRLLSLRPDVTLGGAHDVRDLTRRAALGAILSPAEILEVLDTLRASRNLRNVIVRTAEQRGGLDTLSFIADGITILQNLEGEIERCINDDGEVLDSASPALAKIRVNVRT